MWTSLQALTVPDSSSLLGPLTGAGMTTQARAMLGLSVAASTGLAVFLVKGWGKSVQAVALAAAAYGAAPVAIALVAGSFSWQLALVAPVVLIALELLLVSGSGLWWLFGAALGFTATLPAFRDPTFLVPAAVCVGIGLLLIALVHPDGLTAKLPRAVKILAVAVPVWALALAYPVTLQVFGSNQVTATVNDNHGALDGVFSAIGRYLSSLLTNSNGMTLLIGGVVFAIAIDQLRRHKLWWPMLPLAGAAVVGIMMMTGHAPFRIISP